MVQIKMLCATGAFAAMCASGLHAAPILTIISPGDARPAAISGDGSTVVGQVNSSQQAFRRTSGGTQLLGAITGIESSADGVSHDGSVVVGTSYGPDQVAFRWTGGVFQSLGKRAGSTLSNANDVSANGQVIVGASSGGTAGLGVPFKWTSANGREDLPFLPGGTFARAFGVSADGGTIVGEGNGASGQFALRWTGGVPVSLGTGKASATSADGSVIAGSDFFTGLFRWTSGGGRQNLGLLPGGFSGEVAGMTADGAIIVGASQSNVGEQAVIWTQSTGLVTLDSYLTGLGLNLAGVSLIVANGISGDGTVITGAGIFNGAFRGFVISNVPAPSTVVTMGLAGLIACRRRRG